MPPRKEESKMKTRGNPAKKRTDELSDALDNIRDYIDDLQNEDEQDEVETKPANRLRNRR